MSEAGGRIALSGSLAISEIRADQSPVSRDESHSGFYAEAEEWHHYRRRL
jgi:hypothetical protein